MPNGQVDQGRPAPNLWRFFGLTFALSWGLGGLGMVAARWLVPSLGIAPWIFLAGWAPTLAALILSLRAGGWRGVADLLRTLVRPFHPVWLLAAALILPTAGLLLTLLPMTGFAWPVVPRQILVGLPLVLFASPQILANTGPLGEELGWRGYALPRLLAIRSPLAASLILGAVWAVWHIPAFVLGGMGGQGLAGFGWWTLDTFALATLMTWLYLRAGRNVLVAGMIPHFVINGMGATGAWLSRPPEAALLALIAVGLVLFDRGRMLARPDGLPARPGVRG